MTTRVLVIALDGATLDLVEPWALEGHLPHLRELMDQGSWGSLRSTYPPLTGPAWGSFLTGKSPARHGVLEFFRRVPGTYRQELNSRLDLAGRTLFSWLAQHDLRYCSLGLPLSYPPERRPGSVMISGLLTPPGCRDFVDPPELLDELEAELGEYRLRHDEKYRRRRPEPFLREQFEILENNARAALHLLETRTADLFVVHFLGTDRIQHELWHLLDPSHPQHDPEERRRLGNVPLDFYRAVDSHVGELVRRVGEEAVVLVMSDHGFGPIHDFLNVNTWLLREGFLRLSRRPRTLLRRILFGTGLSYDRLGRLVLGLGLGRRAKRLGRARREELQRRLFLSLDDVDWSRTQAFSLGNYGQIYLNLEGREAEGSVAVGAEAEGVLDRLEERLRALRDPRGGPVVDRVLRREEVYSGPFVEQAPDLVFTTREWLIKPQGLSDFSSPRVFEPVFGTTGHHRPEGLLIARGPGIACHGRWSGPARIFDLAPTLLHLLGLPVPSSMDGEVLADLLTAEHRESNPVFVRQDEPAAAFGVGGGYSETEQKELEERLRALGYVT